MVTSSATASASTRIGVPGRLSAKRTTSCTGVPGEPTDLANLVLLCGFHHHLVHEQNWPLDRAWPVRPGRHPLVERGRRSRKEQGR
jgi:hypothetical protein